MTCTRSGNRWMMSSSKLQHLGSSSSSSAASSITSSSSVSACLWSGCCDALFLWHVSLSLPSISRFFCPPPYLLLSLPFPSSYALHTHACVSTEQLFCHHATWDLVTATSGERWTSGCCLVPTHVYSDLGAKSLCDFTLDAKAFCSACHNQFKHYYKVKHQSPTSKGVLFDVSLHLASLWAEKTDVQFTLYFCNVSALQEQDATVYRLCSDGQ